MQSYPIIKRRDATSTLSSKLCWVRGNIDNIDPMTSEVAPILKSQNPLYFPCKLCRSVVGSSISDHLEYYGVKLGAPGPDACRIVMATHLAAYSTQDQAGNLILSRDPSSSVVKTKSEPGEQINSI